MSSVVARETEKYRRMWLCDEYGEMSPGVEWLPTFLDLVKEEAFGRLPGTVLDIGCGQGRAGALLAGKGFTVSSLDLVDVRVDHVGPFYQGHLWGSVWDRITEQDYGYCCDVLEHLPTEYVGATIDRIVRTCRRTFFSICTEPDAFGVRIGEPLHLTVRPFTWWRDCLKEFGTVLDARDGLNTGVYYVEGPWLL